MKPKQSAPRDMDEYIANFPQEVQNILQKIRNVIGKAAPGAAETIKYRIPTFTLNGNLVHFAAFQNHIGFYPTPTGIERFKQELSGYEVAKGTVRLPLDKPIPYDLITEIVKFRVEENMNSTKATPGK